MAEGIRVRVRPGFVIPDSALVTIIDPARPMPPPADGSHLVDVLPLCSVCGKQHFAKTYHIRLEAGAAIVSTGVWAELSPLADNPFEVINPVTKPPTQRFVLPPASISAVPGNT